MAPATAVRRYKSERNLAPGTALARLGLASIEPALLASLHDAIDDLRSVTRAEKIEVGTGLDPVLERLPAEGAVALGVAPRPAPSPSRLPALPALRPGAPRGG